MSLVDAVLGEARSFTAGLGRTDRETMDQYLASLREMEGRLEAADRWLDVPLERVIARVPADGRRPLAADREQMERLFALRQAAYAVASGAYDSAMAIGVEKVKDSGYQGLNAFPIPTDGTNRTLTAAAMFSMAAEAPAGSR